jgi:hypothetical protein
MKKLASIVLLSLPLIFGSCKDSKDKGYANSAEVKYRDFTTHLVVDFDKDKQADVILNGKGEAEFYALGYEKMTKITSNSIAFTDEVRNAASYFLKAYNEYNNPKECTKNMSKDEKEFFESLYSEYGYSDYLYSISELSYEAIRAGLVDKLKKEGYSGDLYIKGQLTADQQKELIRKIVEALYSK